MKWVRAKQDVNLALNPEPQIRATQLLGCSLLSSPEPPKPKFKKHML